MSIGVEQMIRGYIKTIHMSQAQAAATSPGFVKYTFPMATITEVEFANEQ